MIKYLLPLVLFVSMNTFAQNKSVHYFKIHQKECFKKSAYTFVLQQVINDSRCPEGVSCIWIGEVQITVAVYNDKKLIEQKTMVVNQKTQQENKNWFATYLSSKYKKVQNISLVPYPKANTVIDPKSYYLLLEYIK